MPEIKEGPDWGSIIFGIGCPVVSLARRRLLELWDITWVRRRNHSRTWLDALGLLS